MGGFLIAARFLHFTAAILLTGVFTFERLIAGPAFRRFGAAPANGTRLRWRLGWLAWASLALAIGSDAAWLAAVAAGMSGKPLGAALSQGAVWIVLTRTQFGEDWLLRFALVVLLGFCLLARGRWHWRVSGTIGWTALFLAAAMLASLAWAGHGAATPGLPGDFAERSLRFCRKTPHCVVGTMAVFKYSAERYGLRRVADEPTTTP